MSSEKYTLIEGGILVKTKLSADSDEPYELFLDATAVRKTNDQFERQEKTARILELLDESRIGYDRRAGLDDTNLAIDIGFTSRGYGVYGMDAEMAWPAVTDVEASLAGTRAMRQMAYDLGTYSDKQIPGMVYAHVDRARGITLETNPAGSCSMDTDGSEYRPTADRVTLYAHNLYTHEMQLICIAGLISITQLK